MVEGYVYFAKIRLSEYNTKKFSFFLLLSVSILHERSEVNDTDRFFNHQNSASFF